MRRVLIILVFTVAMAFSASAQSGESNVRPNVEHSVAAGWNFMGFNSTYSKNSQKKTFGTIGVGYRCRFNKWISASGNIGYTHSWFIADADPAYAYPKYDNAIILLVGCNVHWFQKGLFQLYSGVMGGMDVRIQKNNRGSYSTFGFAGQFDAVGAEFAWKRFFASVSAGWGSMGCIRLGVGIKL